MSQRHPFVRLTSTSFVPTCLAAERRAQASSRMPHRGTGVSWRAASLTMRARCYDLRWSARIHQKTSGSRACKRNSRCLTAGRKSNADRSASRLSPWPHPPHAGHHLARDRTSSARKLRRAVLVVRAVALFRPPLGRVFTFRPRSSGRVCNSACHVDPQSERGSNDQVFDFLCALF